MKPIEVTQLKPFASDGWKSIERYGRLLGNLNLNPDKRFVVTEYTPAESFKSLGNFLGRRLIYTAAAAQFRNADIVHILDAAYSNLLMPLNPSRVVITCHDTDVWRSVTKLNRPVRLQLLKSLSRAAVVVTPSKVVSAELENFFRANKFAVPRLQVIANAVDPVFKPLLDKSAIRQSLGISTAPTLLYVANTAWPRKKFDFLVEVLQSLARRKFIFNLIHLGPELSPAQSSRLSQSGLKNIWRTYTNLSDREVSNLYGMADLTLIPSDYEGFGYPLIESSACRTPFLASDIPTFRELMPNQSTLLPSDARVWCEKIELLFRDVDFRAQLSMQTDFLESKFRLSSHLKEYESLYVSVAQAADSL